MNAKTISFRIVRRAFGAYTFVELFEGGLLAAELRAMALEYANADGEYFVRKMDEPDQRPGAAFQSGFDFL